MKTTNYKISKKLAEIGFRADTKNWWILSAVNEPTHQLKTYNRFEDYVGDNYRAYDLETILDALPKQHDFFSRGVGKYELRIWYHEGKAFVGYQNYAGFDKVMTFEQEQNESLADTAGRLIIELYEKNLIKF